MQETDTSQHDMLHQADAAERDRPAAAADMAADSLIHLPGWQSYHPQAFQNRLWICILLTLPVLIFSPNLQNFFKLQPPSIPGIHYMPFILGMLIYIYGGMVFLEGAYRELRRFQPGMMTLSSLAITLTMGYSCAVTFGLKGVEIYWEMCLLTVLLLLGHWLASRSLLTTGRMLSRRLSSCPTRSVMVVDGEEQDISTSDLLPGSEVIVRKGGLFPADGLVISGQSYVDESSIPGMDASAEKNPGDSVLAGTMNQGSEIRMRVVKNWMGSFITRSMQLVIEAQNSPNPLQTRAEQAAYWLAVISVVAASLTSLYWAYAGEDLVFIIERVAAVLVAVSPSAFLLSFPLVTGSVAVSLLNHGIVMLKHSHFELIGRTSYAIFGKTGVVTAGKMSLQRFYNLSILDERELLAWAASVESRSSHPAARAILEAALVEGLPIEACSDFEELSGIGVSGIAGGRRIALGGTAMMRQLPSQLSGERRDAEREASLAGLSIVYLVVDDELKAVLALGDLPVEQAPYSINRLHSMGLRTAIVSGDSEAATQRAAAHLDIVNYSSGVDPDGKIRYVREVKQREATVTVIQRVNQYDDILKEGDVAVALGAAYDIDSLPAGLLLLHGNLDDLPRLVGLSRKYARKIRINLVLALVYNIAVLPFATGLVAPAGWTMPLPLTVIAMFGCILLVGFNSRLLSFN